MTALFPSLYFFFCWLKISAGCWNNETLLIAKLLANGQLLRGWQLSVQSKWLVWVNRVNEWQMKISKSIKLPVQLKEALLNCTHAEFYAISICKMDDNLLTVQAKIFKWFFFGDFQNEQRKKREERNHYWKDLDINYLLYNRIRWNIVFMRAEVMRNKNKNMSNRFI